MKILCQNCCKRRPRNNPCVAKSFSVNTKIASEVRFKQHTQTMNSPTMSKQEVLIKYQALQIVAK